MAIKAGGPLELKHKALPIRPAFLASSNFITIPPTDISIGINVQNSWISLDCKVAHPARHRNSGRVYTKLCHVWHFGPVTGSGREHDVGVGWPQNGGVANKLCHREIVRIETT